MTVTLATIHHEGAGTPSDDPRGAPGGYSYWIGATQWERLRTVDTSYATLHFNHVSLDICLSGNRMVAPVTDNDIALIHGAFMDCHAHGEIVDVPRVQAHRDNNGLYYFNGSLFSTVCPGDLTMARWPEVAAACRVPPPAPPILKVKPMHDPPIRIPPVVADLKDPTSGGGWLLGQDGSIYAFFGAPYLGAMNGKSDWLLPDGTPRTAAQLLPYNGGYEIVANPDGKYLFPRK